jgi:hypothetical protein
MLQLSDCLKYENKNGILDSYDDDKFINADWMRQFNSDVVLLAKFPKENFISGEELRPSVHLSNFASFALHDATLTLVLADREGGRETLFSGGHFSPVSGLSKLVDMTLTLDCRHHAATEYTLEAELEANGQAWIDRKLLFSRTARRVSFFAQRRDFQHGASLFIQPLPTDVRKKEILIDRVTSYDSPLSLSLILRRRTAPVRQPCLAWCRA